MKTYPWDRHPSHPDHPGQSWTAGPGGSQPCAGGQHEGADTKWGWTLPRRGVYTGGHPTPTRTTSARSDQHKGHLLFKAFGPGAAGFVRGGVLQLPSPAPAPVTKAATTVPLCAHPRRPRVPGGGGDPRRPQRAAPPPGAHLKRGESLMHSSNSTVMAAAAVRSLARGPRRSERHARPARSSVSRPARAALGARPPRIEAAAPPPRPACHRRGMSPKSAARARRRLSRPGSVANVRRPRAPPAVTAGERRQTPLPAAQPRLAPARTPRRPNL